MFTIWFLSAKKTICLCTICFLSTKQQYVGVPYALCLERNNMLVYHIYFVCQETICWCTICILSAKKQYVGVPYSFCLQRNNMMVFYPKPAPYPYFKFSNLSYIDFCNCLLFTQFIKPSIFARIIMIYIINCRFDS